MLDKDIHLKNEYRLKDVDAKKKKLDAYSYLAYACGMLGAFFFLLYCITGKMWSGWVSYYL